MKHSIETIGNRTRDLLACNEVSQLTAPPREVGVKDKNGKRKYCSIMELALKN